MISIYYRYSLNVRELGLRAEEVVFKVCCAQALSILGDFSEKYLYFSMIIFDVKEKRSLIDGSTVWEGFMR